VKETCIGRVYEVVRARQSNGSIILAITMVMGLTACQQQPPPEPEGPPPPPAAVGEWRAVLQSPGGELPFTLQITQTDGQLSAMAINGEEQVAFGEVLQSGRKIELRFPWYDAEIKADLASDDSMLRGQWRKTAAGGGNSSLPFVATRGMISRFLPATQSAPGQDQLGQVDGVWKVLFTDEDGTEPAQAEFRQQGNEVSGTFLTPTGDYRFLSGSYEKGVLRLSTFDGAHAFLFTAEAQVDGSLVGDFWSRDTYHATWVAEPAEPTEKILPDSWAMVKLTNDEQRFDFAFESIDGELVSLADERFAGKPVLVNLFGTWCPNCSDEAPLLAQWHRDYAEQGLEIVGLAFEYTGDVERDREMLQRFQTRYDIEYPLLLAGINDKQSAAETLGYVDKVVAYPTTIYLDREHKVQGIHSGFAGPGTGDHHAKLVAELTAKVESLLQ